MALTRQNAFTPQQWESLFAKPCHAVIINYDDSDGEEVDSVYTLRRNTGWGPEKWDEFFKKNQLSPATLNTKVDVETGFQ